MHTHGHSFADKTYDSFYSCQMRITTDKKRKRKDDNWSLSSSVSFNGLLFFSLSLSLRLKMWASVYLWPISFHARIRKKNETFSFFFSPSSSALGWPNIVELLVNSLANVFFAFLQKRKPKIYILLSHIEKTNKQTNEQNKKLSSTRNYLVDKLDTTNSL